MPFLQEGAPAEPGGEIGSGLPPAKLIVQPDKILFLKRGLEDERDKIRSFINHKGRMLSSVPPPGTDPCSEGLAEALSQNGQAALDAATGYVDELSNIIDALDETAKAYGLVEESNADKFGKGPA
ncbi:MAG: PE domain-containing protein [Labedaea sp.]